MPESTDEDPSLRIESFAMIKLRGVSTKLHDYCIRHANVQGTTKISSFANQLVFTCSAR